MAILPVPGMRTVVTDEPGGLCFAIPARRQWFAMVFLAIWLVGWGCGEVFAIWALFSGKALSLFLVAWLSIWTFAGGLAALSWLWMVAGRERVTLKADRLVHRYELFGFGRTREYDLSSVRDLRVSPESFNRWNTGGSMRAWGLGGGMVAFDYGARTVRFAAGVDEAEGKMIVERIRERNPIPDGSG